MKALELFAGTRSIPTHIFTDYPAPGFKSCKRGASCHEAAPRGAQTGTQGINGKGRKKYSAVIPPALCEYVVDLCESGMGL